MIDTGWARYLLALGNPKLRSSGSPNRSSAASGRGYFTLSKSFFCNGYYIGKLYLDDRYAEEISHEVGSHVDKLWIKLAFKPAF